MDGWEDRLSLEVHSCLCCGHFWHAQQPDQEALFGMYAKGRRLRGRPAQTEPSAAMRQEMQSLRKLLKSTRASDRQPALLDFGSGAGRWARAALLAGFDVSAYEPATERAGASDDISWVSSLEQLGEKQFDVINLEQVLEHVPMPVDLLREIRVFAAPDAVLRISVPDVARYARELVEGFPFDGEKMHILSPFEHLGGFNGTSFARMVKRAGLKPLSLTKTVLACPVYTSKRLLSRIGFPWARTTAFVKYVN